MAYNLVIFPYTNSPLIAIFLQGMKYLHNTAVKFHGNLTSTRCVIDGHWVVKITDWGLHEFKAGQENTKKHPNKMYAGAFKVCSVGLMFITKSVLPVRGAAS